jgi:hypothetical protein
MHSHINPGLRASTRKAFLPALAMAALIAGLSPAKAWDQQATSAQMDYELSQRAVSNGFGNGGGYYAQAPGYESRRARTPSDEGRTFARRHRDDR